MARGSSERGFTLIELMIVVAIIAVLATIAGTAYRRYMDSGRTAEAMAMLGEIRAKEEAYRAEFNQYFGWSAGTELESNALPLVDNTTCATGGSKEPCWKSIAPTGFTGAWQNWQYLGINAGKGQLQCGYIVNYGAATANPGNTIGQGLLGSTAVGTPWWYAIGVCNNDGTGNTVGANATFATASNTTVVSVQNEHK